MPPEEDLHLLATFADERPLLACARTLAQRGHRRLEGFSPAAMTDAEGLLTPARTPVKRIMLVAGIVSGVAAYGLEWLATAHAFPLQVASMPLHSWPAFIPICFESTILGACAAGFIAALGLSGLPRLWHPCFELPGFSRVSADRYLLLVSCARSARDEIEAEFTAAGALGVQQLEGPP